MKTWLHFQPGAPSPLWEGELSESVGLIEISVLRNRTIQLRPFCKSLLIDLAENYSNNESAGLPF